MSTRAAGCKPATTPHRSLRPTVRRLREVAKTLALAVVVYLGVRTVVLPYEVRGESMTPNLAEDERLIVNRLAYAHFDANGLWNLLPWEDREGEHAVYPFGGPERGDVVVFDPPEPSDKPYIKRVVGLPGETVGFRDGYVYVDGIRLDESYIAGRITACELPLHRFCDVTVPAGHVFVLGDNRRGSTDSRDFGAVDVDAIVGEAVFATWPLDEVGPLPDAGGGR